MSLVDTRTVYHLRVIHDVFNTNVPCLRVISIRITILTLFRCFISFMFPKITLMKPTKLRLFESYIYIFLGDIFSELHVF